MVVEVRVVLRDGTNKRVRTYDDLAEATTAAFDLADDRGFAIVTSEAAADRVQIVVDDRVELSIRIIRGGLRPRSDGAA